MSDPDPTPPPDPWALPDWAPTSLDVAALLRARTKDESGVEVGDFTAQTRPNDVAIALLIANGCADVISACGGAELPAYLWAEARGVAALKAACQVEASFWPEQVGTDRSPWNELWTMYQFELRNLQAAASASGGPGTILTGSMETPANWQGLSLGWPADWPPDWWQRDLDSLYGAPR